MSRYNSSASASFPDDSGGEMFAVRRDAEDRDADELSVGLEFGGQIGRRWDYTIKASYYDRDEAVSSPGVAPGSRDPFGIPPNSSDSRFERTHLAATGNISLTRALTLSLGVDAQREEGRSDSELVIAGFPVAGHFELDRKTHASFMEAKISPNDAVTLHVGLRVDNPEDFRSETSPRLGMAYRIASSQTTLRANWGKGFKLPSFFALGNAIVGNSSLQPETSESFDVNVTQKIWNDQSHIGVTFFDSRYFDLVDLDEGPPPQLVNRSEVSAKGVELFAESRPVVSLWLNGHVTYTKTDIKDSDQPLRNRPKWRGGLSARWQPKSNAIYHIGVSYVGDVEDSSIPTGARTLESYVAVDAAVTWSQSEDWSIAFAVDNLFDADYEEAVGFPAPGVTPRILTTLRF